MIAAAIVVVAVVLGRVAKMAVTKAVTRGGADPFVGNLLGRLLTYVVVILGLVYALDTLGIAAGPAIGALGIAGIAIAFALQDVLENFVAGVLIQLRRPFTAGQEVVIAGEEGTVVEIDARAVVIDTPDGERLRVPSASVIKNPIVNHTVRGLRRTDLVVGVAYGTDLATAKSTAVSAAQSARSIEASRSPEAFVTEFGDSSINLTIRFWHEPSIRGRWIARDDVAVQVAQAFRTAGIEIPFPQRVVSFPTSAASDQ